MYMLYMYVCIYRNSRPLGFNQTKDTVPQNSVSLVQGEEGVELLLRLVQAVGGLGPLFVRFRV